MIACDSKDLFCKVIQNNNITGTRCLDLRRYQTSCKQSLLLGQWGNVTCFGLSQAGRNKTIDLVYNVNRSNNLEIILLSS